MTPSEVLAKYPGLTWREAQDIALFVNGSHSGEVLTKLDELVTDTLNATRKEGC